MLNWMKWLFWIHLVVEVLVGIVLMTMPGIMNRLFEPDFIDGTLGMAFVRMYGLMAFGFGIYVLMTMYWNDMFELLRCTVQSTIFHVFITIQMLASPLLKGAVFYHSVMGFAFLVCVIQLGRKTMQIIGDTEDSEDEDDDEK
jgi:hypothetical protein